LIVRTDDRGAASFQYFSGHRNFRLMTLTS
jgi:hypothetical protein